MPINILHVRSGSHTELDDSSDLFTNATDCVLGMRPFVHSKGDKYDCEACKELSTSI